MNSIFDFIKENIVLFDIIFLIFIIYFSVQCFAKGFFLSFVSFLKWILALIITIILVPKVEPFISDYIENQFISGFGLGIAIYVISLFILILIGNHSEDFFHTQVLDLLIKLLVYSSEFLRVMFLQFVFLLLQAGFIRMRNGIYQLTKLIFLI